jgi:uncharacterized membrane protein
MRHLKTRLLAICGMMVLAIAALAPNIVNAQLCPLLRVRCGNGRIYSCSGTRQGSSCIYDYNCVSGGECSGG